MAFSQSTFTASEGDGFVLVCTELLTGILEIEISLLVDVLDLESNTGTSNVWLIVRITKNIYYLIITTLSIL